MASPERLALPRELIESQLAMVELIQAMYPPPEEEANGSEQELIAKMRDCCENADSASPSSLPTEFSFTVTVPVETEQEHNGTATSRSAIQLKVVVPLASEEEQPMEPPALAYTIRQPSWMSRAEVTDLSSGMPANDVLAAFDYVKDEAPKYLERRQMTAAESEKAQDAPSGPLVRVWFYFPSLSTREKRKDLVNYAPRYRLTGFVLAGKPGVLCLEGTSTDVGNYMNAIKNESWGDIPSHQKKVSERFREECGEDGRRFQDMREITDDLGEKRGARKNRGDMAALETFLKEKNVGDSFAKVIMGA